MPSARDQADLDLIQSAAAEADAIAMRHFRADPETWEKDGGQGPVTEADIAIDRMLREELSAARPDYGWLSEETEDDPARLARDTVFIVDPIDGTRSFIAGQTSWGVAIAVARAGVVTAAVMRMPAKGRTYSAVAGGGAYRDDEPIAAGEGRALDGARMLATGYVMKDRFWGGETPAVERQLRASLQYRLCLVSEAKFDAMLTLRPAWEWDVAAGDLIAREAGAAVTDRAGAKPLYNQAKPRIPGVVLAAPKTHAEILARLTPEAG